MSSFLTAWYNRPTAILTWACTLILWGVWTVVRVPLEWVPQVELPELHINVSWSGANPRAMERYVTAPLERAVQDVAGTTSVASFSQEGSASITLKISENTDPTLYAAAINERLAMVRPTLPEHVFPYLSKEIPEALREQQGFMTLQLIGNLAPDALRKLAEEEIAPKLRVLPGVGRVSVSGGTAHELKIALDPAKLAAYRLSSEAVKTSLMETLDDVVYGRLRMQGRAMLLLTPAEQSAAKLRDIRLPASMTGGKDIGLSEVAELSVGEAPVEHISRIDGQNVVTITLDRAHGSHLLQTAEAVQHKSEQLKQRLPQAVRILVADDRSEAVRAELQQLAWQGSIGLLLVVFVLLFMLKSIRVVAIVLFSVILAFSISFVLLTPLGLTLNLITLGGLVLVFGMLADNAVVVVVEWMRVHKPGMPIEDTVRKVLSAVWMPLLGGTLTTSIVILPLVYLSGALQKLFLPFGILTTLTLLASLASAVLVVPVLGRFLPPSEATNPKSRLRQWSNAPFRWIEHAPRFTLWVLILFIGIPFWLLPLNFAIKETENPYSPKNRLKALYNDTIGSDFFQEVRTYLDPYMGGVARPFFETTNFGQSWKYKAEPEVSVSMEFPPGNPIARADSLIHQFELVALANASVKQTLVQVSEQSASLRIKFKEDALETVEPFVVREDLIQQAVLLAGISISVNGLLPQGYYSASGVGISGMMVDAFGPNYEDLAAFSEKFATKLKQNARVAEVDTDASLYGRSANREFLRYRWATPQQQQTHVAPSELANALRPIFSTRVPIAYADLGNERRLPIRMTLENEFTDLSKTDIGRLAEMPLPITPQKSISLGKNAFFEVVPAPSDIERENQQYKRHIMIDYRGPYELGYKFLQDELASMPLPAGYKLEMSNHNFFTEEVQQSFGWALLATIGLVYLVMVFVFESWRVPFVVLLSIPTAFAGVALAFIWREANFAEGAFIGAVLLTGVAVNNGILLMASYRNMGKAHPTRKPFVLLQLAIRKRLRPMWATTLVAVVGMLPVLVAPETNDFWLGLSATVTGGLLSSTLLIPFVMMAFIGKRHKKTGESPKQKYLGFIKWNPLGKG
ncbi:MAG: efflux RND transporter permease subunit [Bacteroidetes Order II. Incertae sedis bacterium]|nr:efflux RND transporter permease subunit [Bacteroidetes Order II. bacterium]